MRTRATPTAFTIIALLSSVSMAADPVGLPGKIDAVTVYRGQALVTRLVDVPGPAGLREVLVTGLPEQVVPGSIFAEADGGVEVRSVRFRTRPVSQDVREDVRKLDAQIRDAQDNQAANTRTQQLNSERKSYLDKLEQFVAPTASTELTRGVLNAETLKTLTVFIFDQRQLLASEDLKLARAGRDLQDQLTLLQRQLDDLSAGASKTVREAVVFADFKQAGGQVRLKYLVNSASWSPSYVVRAKDGKGQKNRPVTVQYNASVQQMSGEDWSDVAMTLSTATPSMVATAPELDPLAITLAAGQVDRLDGASYDSQKIALSQQRQQIEAMRNSNNHFGSGGGGGMGANAPGSQEQNTYQTDSDMNALAGKLQVLELVAKDAGGKGGRGGRDAGASLAAQEGLSVIYLLPSRTSLPSRDDQQSIQIAAMEMTGAFYKLAMPVLTSYVYDQATVTNQTQIVMLAGQVQSYFNDQYVGVGSLPTISAGEQFTVGFGIDSSLRATRELVDKTETTQAGNRVMNFSYRLTVENFGSGPVEVRVEDRLPTTKNADVKITLVSHSKEPSTQPVGPIAAGSAANHAGILNWSIQVPPQAMGDNASVIDYQYHLEFDKQLSIAGMMDARK